MCSIYVRWVNRLVGSACMNACVACAQCQYRTYLLSSPPPGSCFPRDLRRGVDQDRPAGEFGFSFREEAPEACKEPPAEASPEQPSLCWPCRVIPQPKPKPPQPGLVGSVDPPLTPPLPTVNVPSVQPLSPPQQNGKNSSFFFNIFFTFWLNNVFLLHFAWLFFPSW